MLQTLITEHDNLLHNHELLKSEYDLLKHKYEQSEKARKDLNIKYVELFDKHTTHKNNYMKIRRNFECICILYAITGGLYYINLIESHIFYATTIIMILLSLIMS